MTTNKGPGSRLEYPQRTQEEEDQYNADCELWQQMEEECNNDEGE